MEVTLFLASLEKFSRYASKYGLQKKSRNLKKIGGVSFDFWIVVGLFLVFTTLYGTLAFLRHNHFQSQGIDFSIYDQPLWLYSRIQAPYSTVTSLYDLSDRLRPIMLPISTLYWFTNNERIILFFQAIILSSAIFPLWFLARRILPAIATLTICFAYLNFVGIQSVNAYDFHEMSVLPFFLAGLFLFLEKRMWRSYFVTLIFCLAVREYIGFLLATIGVYIWTVTKNTKVALATAFISLAWSISAIWFIMPYLGQQHYSSFVEENDSLAGALLNYAKNPFTVTETFFLPFEKTSTVFWSFLSFGFLPIIFLPLLPSIFFQLASRFLDQLHPVRWTLYYHYSADLGVLMAVATIFTTGMLLRKFPKRNVLVSTVLLIILGQFLSSLFLHTPFKNLLKKSFYQEPSWSINTKTVLSHVPKNASMAAQNNLLPHLDHRKYIYLLPKTGNAQYVVFDLHPGQNDWNFYTGNLQIATAQLKELISKNLYKPIISAGDVYLLERN